MTNSVISKAITCEYWMYPSFQYHYFSESFSCLITWHICPLKISINVYNAFIWFKCYLHINIPTSANILITNIVLHCVYNFYGCSWIPKCYLFYAWFIYFGWFTILGDCYFVLGICFLFGTKRWLKSFLIGNKRWLKSF